MYGGGGLVAKLCLTLCDPMDCSPPGSSVRGISQERILESVALSYSRVSSRPRDQPVSPELQADFLLMSHEGRPFCYVYFTTTTNINI